MFGSEPEKEVAEEVRSLGNDDTKDPIIGNRKTLT
jgi:hypothetical protein